MSSGNPEGQAWRGKSAATALQSRGMADFYLCNSRLHNENEP